MLHIVNRSPFERNSLETCLRMVQTGSAILLIEDGVIAATKGTPFADRLAGLHDRVAVYALGPYLDARGLRERTAAGIRIVDYGGFVDLVTENSTVQSWL